jgi:hypothetical protein
MTAEGTVGAPTCFSYTNLTFFTMFTALCRIFIIGQIFGSIFLPNIRFRPKQENPFLVNNNVNTFSASANNTSINLEKLVGAPINPCGQVCQWYWPFPGMVKAMKGRSKACNCNCQNALAQSSAE